MGFLSPGIAEKARLRKSKEVLLGDGDIKVRVAGLLAAAAFDMSGLDPTKSKANLFMASCIDDAGKALFKNAAEVDEFLKQIDIDDATHLLEEITSMNKSMGKKKVDELGEAPAPAAT